jgi:hypothetical protein
MELLEVLDFRHREGLKCDVEDNPNMLVMFFWSALKGDGAAQVLAAIV